MPAPPPPKDRSVERAGPKPSPQAAQEEIERLEKSRRAELEQRQALQLPPFPWPPPRPSSRDEIDRKLLVGDASPTLRSVADRLEAALRGAGYEYSFYAVPAGGFALAARLERIDDDGAALGNDRRFLPPNAREPFDLSRYLSQLFFAAPGYYRMIALIVTDQPFVADTKALDSNRARSLPGSGASALPSSFAERPFGPDHRVFVLIYEFRKGDTDGDVAELEPGRLPASTHLSRSGLQRALEAGR
jgi:hypothetical protein